MGKKHAVEADELATAEALLDKLDPVEIDSSEADATDLRRIGEAAEATERARDALAQAVASASSHGRSWGQIGMVLGVSRQAARERFGTPSPRSATE